MSRKPLVLLTLLLAAACADEPLAPTATGLATPLARVTAADITVVMSGLNSPRGLDWGPEGALYVAEAGTVQIAGSCVPFLEGMTLATKCYSGTGSVSRLWHDSQSRVATGLPSTYIVESGFASGPQDISFVGRGNALVAIGWGGDPALRGVMGGGAAAAGTLVQLAPSGVWHVVADISAFEATHNPAGGMVDSNPYGVLAEPGRTWVVDAGGNSLLEVTRAREISLVAIFPTTPAPPPFLQSAVREHTLRCAVPDWRGRHLPRGARSGAAAVCGRLQDDHRFCVRRRRHDVRTAVCDRTRLLRRSRRIDSRGG
jgi:hypothetical protein